MTEAQPDYSHFFYEEFAPVVRTVALIMRDPIRAEDVAQEAFLRLFLNWNKISRYENPAGLGQARRHPPRCAGNAPRPAVVADQAATRPGRSAPILPIRPGRSDLPIVGHAASRDCPALLRGPAHG